MTENAAVTRYDQLLTLIDDLTPYSIIEIGVARAVRARTMTARALLHVHKVIYTGYDVFDTEDEEFHRLAYNHKTTECLSWCSSKMRHAAKAARKQGKSLDYRFVVGDTRKTLHGRKVKADFVFIDGDHRVETIRGDYRALRKSRVIAFDDYFEADDRGIPDISRYGCNMVVDEARKNPKVTIEILPHADPCKIEGQSKLAVIRWK